MVKYGQNWLDGIPQGVIKAAKEKAQKDKFQNPQDLLDSTDFPHLKEISTFKDNYNFSKNFYGDLPKDKFIELMDFLYELRNKIAHADRSFSKLDLDSLISTINDLSRGDSAENIREYIRLKKYTEFKCIPDGFIIPKQESLCQSNLPSEDYDLETGFIGREEYKKKLIKRLYSDLDRIITITGGGGVGKTALALNTVYTIKYKLDCPFQYIIWFSAKTNKLTPEGIIEIVPQIKCLDQLVTNILSLIQPENKDLLKALGSRENIQNYLYDILKRYNLSSRTFGNINLLYHLASVLFNIINV